MLIRFFKFLIKRFNCNEQKRVVYERASMHQAQSFFQTRRPVRDAKIPREPAESNDQLQVAVDIRQLDQHG